jgi:quercetin dioxygenase-like cupin family protein/mannose-6-phosphate isomerase-like protein (cupin superfamily)
MKCSSIRSSVCSLLLSACAALPAWTIAADSASPDPSYASLQGEVLLDNARVRVQKFVIEPGHATGQHGHPAEQLLVFIKGGVLRSQATGRSTLWRDGRVVWESAGDPADAGATNTGATPIEVDLVTLKPVTSPAAASVTGKPKYQYLNYPNIPGEDLLENDEVIVQRFTVQPGQWEGVHAHHPDMLYIHIKGGQWAEKTYKEPEHPYPNASPDGEVGWMPTIDISVGHQSRNIGKNPIDLIWVTLKK